MKGRAIISYVSLILLMTSCRNGNMDRHSSGTDNGGDTITAVTLHVPQFIGSIENGTGCDYHANLVSKISHDCAIPIRLIRTSTIDSIYDYLDNGTCQLAAFDIAPDATYTMCGDSIYSSFIILKHRQDKGVKSILDLDSTTIYYISETDRKRLEALREETGQRFEVKAFNGNTDEAINGLIAKEIGMLACNDFIASPYLYKYPELDLSLTISLPSVMSWCTTDDSLAVDIDKWFDNNKWKQTRTECFYSCMAYTGKRDFRYISKSDNVISPYDHLFKRYAKTIGWDWQMLAALSFAESNFDQEQVSPSGAIGLMQLMPITAKAHGYKKEDLFNAELNIRIATLYIKTLQKYFSRITPADERNKFIIGAYNSGIGHIFDAIALTKKYNANPDSWDDVSKYLLLKKEEQYYKDEVCKHGQFNGIETISLVKKVFGTFFFYKN